MCEEYMEAKPWYQSKTILGAGVTVAASIGALMGIDISAADQSAITESLMAIAGGIGGAIAIYGRIKADTPISK
jgi:hypothetical protein